jgi:hypothetical protein
LLILHWPAEGFSGLFSRKEAMQVFATGKETFMKRVLGTMIAVLGFGLLVGGNEAGDAKPKYTIKQVMQKAMQKKAYEKLQKDDLIELFTALAANSPPAGEAESWKVKTRALLVAAKSGDAKQVNTAAACTACHNEHKKKKV